MQTPPAYPNQAPYPPGPPMQQPQPKKGFPVWAIILLVVAGLGVMFAVILVVLGIYGTRKYLAAAKSAEAKSSVGAISRAAQTAYEHEQLSDDMKISHRLCATGNPVPASMASVKGMKYQPNSASGTDFNVGDAKTGWPCLKFSMTMPIYYRYQYHQGSGYLAPGSAAGANGFEASAQGDLDGDGTPSTFARSGMVGKDGTVVLSPSLYIDNEFE